MGDYCPMHFTIMKNKAESVIQSKVKSLFATKYVDFIAKLKSVCKGNQLSVVQLEELLASYHLSFSDRERKAFMDAYHIKSDQTKENVMVNVDKIIEADKTTQIKKIYDQVNLEA